MFGFFIPLRRPNVKPAIFEEFFGLDQEEIASPFLIPSSRKWAFNLTLRSALAASVFLIFALIFSFYPALKSISYLLLFFVYFLAGIPALIESIEDLLDLNVNIDVLMTLAAFSSVLIGSGFEGALLLVLFAISGSIEDMVTASAKGSLSQLHKLSPNKATIVGEEGHLIEKAIREIDVGTHILVRPGEIVPLDGTVVEGISSVNLVHLTGESLPVLKKLEDTVPAGARNLDGVLTLFVTHTAADSTLAKIIQLITGAQEAKPQLQRWFDSFSQTYALTIIGLAFLFAISFPPLLGISFFGSEGSIYRSLAFLIAASPCALILALPIAYLSAISAAAKKGILLKGGVILDALSKCRVIAFDKTGTLTKGELSFKGLSSLSDKNADFEERSIWEIAYALEKNAVHPIAKAINTYAEIKNIQSAKIKDFQLIPGYGVKAIAVLDKTEVPVFMGHPDYILPQLTRDQQAVIEAQVDFHRSQGQIIAILKMRDKYFLFVFEDEPRPLFKETLKRIKEKSDLKLLMLTGDHAESAKRVAQEFGLTEYYSNLKPEDKLEIVANISKKQGLIMVGDGINDAPALARATVGICMGKVGSGAALDAAEIVLLHDNLEYLDWLLDKANKTQSIVKQNLFIAIFAIFLASIPALVGIVPLWLAVIMHEGGTVLVGLNGLRLLKTS